MNDEAPDEREWLGQFARDGCGESFRQLVARHEKMVRAVAMRRLGDPQEAEEVAQVVFTILARKGPDLGRIGSLGAWLHRVTVLECRKAWRTKQRERKGLEMIRENIGREHDPSWARLREEVDEAFDRLSREDREVLVLHYVEGRTFRETASRLRTTAEASRKRCSRALEKLTALLRKRGVAVPAVALGVWLGKEFAAHAGGIAAPALAKLALAGAGRDGSGPAFFFLTTMKTLTGGCFMVGLIAPFCWKMESLGSSAHREPSAGPAGEPPRLSSDDGGRRRATAPFDPEMIRKAFARLDDATDPERWREAELRKLMFALNADELPQVLEALKDVRNKDRFGGIARALFARWAEIDGPAAVEMALATKDFGKEPMRGAFVTWATLDETAALAWLEREKLQEGYDLGREWLRWKIGTDLADAAVAAERLSALFPDRKKDLYRWVTKEWAVKDSHAAADWILAEKDTPLRDDLLEQLVRHYGETGGLKTFTYAASISNPAKRESVLNDTLRWTGVRGGRRMLKELAEPGLSSDWSDENLRKFAEGLMVNRPDRLNDLAGMATNEEQRQRIYEGALQGIMWNEPKDAVEAANKVNDSFLAIEWGAKAYSDYAKRWFTRDPEGASRWLDTLEAGPKREIAEAARQAITRTKHSHQQEAEQ